MKECTKCQEKNIAAVFKLMDQRDVCEVLILLFG